MRSPLGDTERTALILNLASSNVQTRPDGVVRRSIAQDGFWTVKELARYLRMSVRWVHELTRRSGIPCYRFGTILRFDPQEIAAWTAKFHQSSEDSGSSVGGMR